MVIYTACSLETQADSQSHTDMLHAKHGTLQDWMLFSFHIFHIFTSVFFFFSSLLLSEHRPEPSWVFMRACPLIRESFPICPEHCRQPVSPSALLTHAHTHAHMRRHLPANGGGCHLRRQLQLLVWLLSSNQRPSSLSTATRPWGHHCHMAHTTTAHPPNTHTHWHTGEEEEEVEKEVAVFYPESWFPLSGSRATETGRRERKRERGKGG